MKLGEILRGNMTIGNTNTSSKEVITKFNAAIRSIPDCSSGVSAEYYCKKIKEAQEDIENLVREIESRKTAIEYLNKKVESLR